MKRASVAAATALAALMAGTAATAETAPSADSVKQLYTQFRENSISLALQGKLDEVKALYGRTLADDFKGRHTTTLTVTAPNESFDTGEVTGRPGEIVISQPGVALTFSLATNKAGYMTMIEQLDTFLKNPPSFDVAIAAPIVMDNSRATVTVQDVQLAQDGTTATVRSTIDGTVDSDKIMEELGLLPPPPGFEGVDVNVNMDCVSVLALDNGGFTVKSEDCTGGVKASVRTNNALAPGMLLPPMMPLHP
jgi:hypothetical protein